MEGVRPGSEGGAPGDVGSLTLSEFYRQHLVRELCPNLIFFVPPSPLGGEGPGVKRVSLKLCNFLYFSRLVGKKSDNEGSPNSSTN
jgi:hypothetical protein